jgi:hypothetical protein
MHFCTAKIQIGGDNNNVMVRDHYSPVSWPEIALLTVIHGEGSVIDVEPFVYVKQPPRNERGRLDFIYGRGPGQVVWGGQNAPDEMDAPKVKLKAGIQWLNPITSLLEITTKDGSKQVDPKARPAPPPPAQEHTSLAETVGDPRPGNPDDDDEFAGTEGITGSEEVDDPETETETEEEEDPTVKAPKSTKKAPSKRR